MKIDPIDLIPGPSPQFMEEQGSFATQSGEYYWRKAGREDFGSIHLINRLHEPILLLGGGVYAQARRDDRMLLWYEHYEGTAPEWGYEDPNRDHPEGRLCFYLLQLDTLPEIHNLKVPLSDPRVENQQLYFKGRAIAQYAFATNILAGEYPIESPQEFTDWGEILALAHCWGQRDPSDSIKRAIFSFAFDKKQVKVFPQDWYNKGPYDHAYQWIWRVSRDEAGRIIGEGVRLGQFRLDRTARKVEAWGVKNDFFHLS